MTSGIMAKRARLDVLPLIMVELELALLGSGYTPALYGSVAKFGEGRDFDFFLVPLGIEPVATKPDLLTRLISHGFTIHKTAMDTGPRGWYGVLAMHSGYALDLSVKESL